MCMNVRVYIVCVHVCVCVHEIVCVHLYWCVYALFMSAQQLFIVKQF